MKKLRFLAAVGLAAIAVLGLVLWPGMWRPAGAVPPATPAGPTVLAAGPGRVEPISEEISLGAQISGKLQAVLIEEGDRVLSGQAIAVLENREYSARVRSAEAELLRTEAELRKVLNGARAEERREAAADLAEAEAVSDNAQLELARRQGLRKGGVISQEEADRVEQQARVARARVDGALARDALIQANAREEDRARVESDVALALARLDEARAVYEKTFVRAPLSGVILRTHRRVGESVSTQFDSPIATIADKSTLRVRVDVDEGDVAKVSVGQWAYVTADAFGGNRFWGRVVRVGQLLGRKNLRTDEPTERVDAKILEVLVQLDEGQELPLGLRVQAFIVGER